MAEREISLGVQHWIQTRPVWRNVPSGRGDVVISEAASSNPVTVLLAIVYFFAKVTRRVFAELPEEDGGGPGSQRCGMLKNSLYGTRDAAQNWERELGEFLEEVGLHRGKASTCLYRRNTVNQCFGTR